MPIVVNVIQNNITPYCLTISSFVFGKIFSVKKIQIGNEIPERKNVKVIVLKLRVMLSIRCPLIPNIAIPASPTNIPGNMYMSKFENIKVKIVM